MAAAATRGDRRTIYDDATRVKTLLQQRVSGVVTPHNARDALFVVIFNYVVGMRECEVMRLFLQRGSELLGVSIGVAVRAKVKIEWPRLRPRQDDGVADLSVSQ